MSSKKPRWREQREHVVLRLRSHQPGTPRRDDRRQPRQNGRHILRPGSARRVRDRPPLDLCRVLRSDPPDRHRTDRTRYQARRPDRDVVTEHRRVADDPVRHRASRRDPGEHQPRIPNRRTGVRAEPVVDVHGHRGAGVQEFRLRVDARQCARALPRPQRRDHRGVGTVAADRRNHGRRRRAGTGAVRLEPRRSDQHPVHVGHHRISQGRHADSHQHPQQRLPRRRGPGVHRAGPGLHTGAVLPLLRNGAWQSRLHDARCRHGDPRDPGSSRRRR